MDLGSVRFNREDNGLEVSRLSLHVHALTCLVGVLGTSEREPYPLRKWSLYIGPFRLTFRWRTDAA